MERAVPQISYKKVYARAFHSLAFRIKAQIVIVNLRGEDVKGIAVLADRHTVTCFKLAGLSDIFSVEDIKEAEKQLSVLMEKKDIKIVLVSVHLMNNSQLVEKISELQCPLIIPIPDLQEQKMRRTDLMVEFIRHKTGIEVKI
jgi:vacuolar-type H+-ATPase subunit F/Vma7